jgi:hypothetical protein
MEQAAREIRPQNLPDVRSAVEQILSAIEHQEGRNIAEVPPSRRRDYIVELDSVRRLLLDDTAATKRDLDKALKSLRAIPIRRDSFS